MSLEGANLFKTQIDRSGGRRLAGRRLSVPAFLAVGKRLHQARGLARIARRSRAPSTAMAPDLWERGTPR